MAIASPLFTFRLIPLISAELARRGIDAGPLVAEAGLPLDALRGEITAPLARIQHFIELAAARLGTRTLGLELAERVPPGAYGVAEFLVRSAPSVETGLGVLCEFAALINPIGHFQLSEGRLHYSVAGRRDTLGVHLNEYTLAYIVRNIGAVLGGTPVLKEAWFSHERRGEAADLVGKRFGCPVRFGAADCGFALPPAELARRPRTADEALFEFLLGQARGQLARVSSDDIVSHAARVIELRLAHADVDIAAVASALGTTARSLQRHLANAGTSYRELLAHVRLRRRGELRHARLDDAALARQLGFADARSMRRAMPPEE